MSTALTKFLSDISERLDRRMYECSKLIQPDKSFVQDTMDLNLAVEVISAMKEALAWIAKKDGFCIFGTADMAEEPDNAFRQGSALTYSECAEKCKEAFAEIDALLSARGD